MRILKGKMDNNVLPNIILSLRRAVGMELLKKRLVAALRARVA